MAENQIYVPPGQGDEFKQVVERRRARRSQGQTCVETQAEQFQILQPFITAQEKFWLMCDMAPQALKSKIELLELDTLQLANVSRAVQRQHDGWVAHIELQGPVANLINNTPIEEVAWS